MKKLLFAALLCSAMGMVVPASAQDVPEPPRKPKKRNDMVAPAPEPPMPPEPPSPPDLPESPEPPLPPETAEEVREALSEAEDEIKDAIREVEEAMRQAEGTHKETLRRTAEQLRQTLQTIRRQRLEQTGKRGEIQRIEEIEIEKIEGENEGNGGNGGNDTLRKSSKDSTIINIGKRQIIINRKADGKKTISIQKDKLKAKTDDDKPKNYSVGLFSLDLGFNALLDQGSFSLSESNRDFELRQGPSLHVTTRFLKTRVNLIKNHVHLVTALEFDFQNYKFRKPVTIESRSERFDYRFDTGAVYSVNKLSASYFQVPLMLHFTAKNRRLKRCFRVSAGGYAGILLNAWTKQERDNGKTTVTDDRFHVDPIRYGLSFRIGYGIIELYSNYNLNPLFKQNEGGPNLHPLCFGIKLVDF